MPPASAGSPRRCTPGYSVNIGPVTSARRVLNCLPMFSEILEEGVRWPDKNSEVVLYCWDAA